VPKIRGTGVPLRFLGPLEMIFPRSVGDALMGNALPLSLSISLKVTLSNKIVA
jgi:hypothetical protein